MSTFPKIKRKLLVTGDYTYLITPPKAGVKTLIDQDYNTYRGSRNLNGAPNKWSS